VKNSVSIFIGQTELLLNGKADIKNKNSVIINCVLKMDTSLIHVLKVVTISKYQNKQ